MGGCAAIGCSNQASKKLLMKAFPRDPVRRKQWTEQVNRMNWEPTNYSRLCEVHFAPEMWEKPRQDGKRVLKWNAVPTIFNYSKESTIKKRKPPAETMILQPIVPVECIFLEPELTVLEETVKLEPEASCSTAQQQQTIVDFQQPFSSSCSSPSAQSLSQLKFERQRLQNKLRRYQINYKKLLEKTKKQKTQIQSLKRKIRCARIVKEGVLNGIFNSDQVWFIKWPKKTVTK